MCKTWYNGNPNPICTYGQVWICCDQEMVEQAHVGHRLQQSDIASVDVVPQDYLRTCLAWIADCPFHEDVET
jgi:hypothetical protein